MQRLRRRTSFEITDERMFWEVDPESEPFVADTNEAVTDTAVSAATDTDADLPVTLTEPPLPHRSSGLRELDVVDNVEATRESTFARAGALLPEWALEPDWVNDTPVTRERTWRTVHVIAGGAVGGLALVVAVLSLAGGRGSPSPAPPRRPATVATANGRTTPMVVTGFASARSKPARSDAPRRPARVPHKPVANLPAEGRPRTRSATRPQSSERRSAASHVTERAATATWPRARVASRLAPLPRVARSVPARAPSGSSEFNFER
jgi:hypothetical protein